MIDINDRANKLVLAHVRKLQKEIEEKKQEARDIYKRSNMPIPKWCLNND